MSYATVDYAIKTLGRGALLANFDITNAYRVILVHPTDRLLLGLPLRGDTLWTEHFISVSGRRRTASRQWLMPQSEGGMSFMPCTIWTISLYLAPLTPRNVAGRCRRLSRASWRDPRLSFLGILIDSENDMLSFPADKCARLRSAISESRDRKFCRKRELLSLIGQLQYALEATLISDASGRWGVAHSPMAASGSSFPSGRAYTLTPPYRGSVCRMGKLVAGMHSSRCLCDNA